MIKLAAFDIAGTTVDDGGAVYDALRRAVEELGATVAETDLAHWMGTDKVTAITNLARLGGVDLTPAAAHDAFRRFQAILADSYRVAPPAPVPGAEEAIARLQAGGVKVALTTGFDRTVVEPLLQSLGWGHEGQPGDHAVVLDAVITTDDVPAGRPAPYMIFRAMERCGVDAVADVLAAGDTSVDVQAANNAGAISVGVLSGQTPEAVLREAGADHVLASVAEVPRLRAVAD